MQKLNCSFPSIFPKFINMGRFTFQSLSSFFAVLAAFCLSHPASGQVNLPDQPSLGKAFNAGAPEVEPVVVGREKWNQKPSESLAKSPPESTNTPRDTDSTPSKEVNSAKIDELDALETKQVKPDPSTLPLAPPKNKPAVKIVRNFEGKLLFKPRKFGFEEAFPFQLLNSRGKRLAFIDFAHIKAVEPRQFADQQVNILGKLEPIEQGSDELVIRARVIRPSN